MNLRVKATVLALASLAFLAGGGAAFADEEDDRRPAPGSTELPRPHHPHPEEDELHDRYALALAARKAQVTRWANRNRARC